MQLEPGEIDVTPIGISIPAKEGICYGHRVLVLCIAHATMQKNKHAHTLKKLKTKTPK